MFPGWVQAGFWGLVAGSALLIGAWAGYFTRISARWVAAVSAFGSGVLISALAFDLMNVAYQQGGFIASAAGFITGAVIYTLSNLWLAHRGAKHRKRSGQQQPSEAQNPGSGLAIALGSLLDDIPESIVIGLSLLQGSTVSIPAVVAIFLSNVPEGLSSAAGMKKAKRSPVYIFGIWGGLMVITALAALAGYVLFAKASTGLVAAITALAAGAILCMLVDTMIPEAYETAHAFAGLITVIGFLLAFVLTKLT